LNNNIELHIFRHDGGKIRSSTVSTQIGNLCSEFFGLFLNVTSLRAINNTAVRNACAQGHINHNQLEEYDTECQGHSTAMGKKAYDRSREGDRAKNLQSINDLINNKCNESFDSGDAESEDNTSEEMQLCREKRKRDEDYNSSSMIHKKKKVSSDVQLQEKHSGDWGKKHPCYDKKVLKVKWSSFEKDYIQALFDKYPSHKHNVWRHCLDSILNTNDENVRQQFHVSHLELVKLKDAIRVKKSK
jgi:hypothetical protein